MKVDKKDMLLYAVTDDSWLCGKTLASQVEEAILGGATFIQLREKEAGFDDFLKTAFEVKAVCKKYGVPFVINDNVDVALACDADGVHIGQSDMGCRLAREKLGEGKIIGVSAQTVQQAMLAESQGADYLGVGAVFSTSTKKDASVLRLDTLQEICRIVNIPVVAIGGISRSNILTLGGRGLAGVAVVSAIFAQKDVRKAAKELLSLSKEMVQA